MKAQLILGMALTLASAAASAGGTIDIQDLANRSGLSARQVRMVVGAPTSFAEYRTSYARAEAALRRSQGGANPRALAQRMDRVQKRQIAAL